MISYKMKTLVLLLMTNLIFAQNDFSISFGQVSIGEKRIQIDLKNFKLVAQKRTKNIRTRVIRNSTQWVRTKDNLLAPRAMTSISVKSNKNIYFRYVDKNIIPQGNKIKSTKLYVNIYDPKPIEVYEDGKKINTLVLRSNIKLKNKSGHLIDYSCSPYNLKINGLDDQYLSVGCRRQIIGKMGSERNQLIVTLATSNFHLKSGHESPYTIILTNPSETHLELENSKGEKRIVEVSARFSKYAHRLKTAIGFGPYYFKSRFEEDESKSEIAPAFMLYGKWELSQTTSFRIFDALIARDSIFNNGGLYFAYDLARVFDNRIKIVPLLGFQILTHTHSKDTGSVTKIIYPQGFEATFSHVFGIENFHVIYGMFLSTDDQEAYSNSWIRWGKKYFWELNYIHWGRSGREATMWGLSVGIPTGQYF